MASVVVCFCSETAWAEISSSLAEEGRGLATLVDLPSLLFGRPVPLAQREHLSSCLSLELLLLKRTLHLQPIIIHKSSKSKTVEISVSQLLV